MTAGVVVVVSSSQLSSCSWSSRSSRRAGHHLMSCGEYGGHDGGMTVQKKAPGVARRIQLFRCGDVLANACSVFTLGCCVVGNLRGQETERLLRHYLWAWAWLLSPLQHRWRPDTSKLGLWRARSTPSGVRSPRSRRCKEYRKATTKNIMRISVAGPASLPSLVQYVQ